jgi:apolipoprotein N-acyltransferase
MNKKGVKMGRTARTLSVVFGWLIWWFATASANTMINSGLGIVPLHFVLSAIGLGLSLYGCYLWAKLKNRHWAWMFFGILTPIGLLPLALMKDRS